MTAQIGVHLGAAEFGPHLRFFLLQLTQANTFTCPLGVATTLLVIWTTLADAAGIGRLVLSPGELIMGGSSISAEVSSGFTTTIAATG